MTLTQSRTKWPAVLRREDVCIECLNKDGKREKPTIIEEGKYFCSKHALEYYKKRKGIL